MFLTIHGLFGLLSEALESAKATIKVLDKFT